MRAVPLLLLLAACAPERPAPPAEPPAEPPRIASADTVDVQGVSAVRATLAGGASGTVTLRAMEGGTRVLMAVDGLDEDTYHGVQILSTRSCDDADGSPHLGDGRATHGPYDAVRGRRHAGDLGNIRADDRGRGRFDRIDPHVTLAGYLSAANRAFVVREEQDDGVTLPDGGSGGILACGVLSPAR